MKITRVISHTPLRSAQGAGLFPTVLQPTRRAAITAVPRGHCIPNGLGLGVEPDPHFIRHFEIT